MPIQIQICPQCGAPVSAQGKACQYCGAEFIVSNFSSISKSSSKQKASYISQYKGFLAEEPDNTELGLALGICYLDTGNYEIALKTLEKAIALMPNNPEVYFYYALALIKGRKPRIITLNEIKKIEEYIQSAINFGGEKSKYYILSAIIKSEYYTKNGIRIVGESVEELIEIAMQNEYERSDIEKLCEFTKLDNKSLIQCIIK